MAPTDKNGSKNRSKRKTIKSKPKAKKEKTLPKPTPSPGIQRIENGGGGGGVRKMPSNAPTMAIAPSDYEHIYHEGTGGPGNEHSPAPSPPHHTPTPPALASPQLPAGLLPGGNSPGGTMRPMGFATGGAGASPRPHFAGGGGPMINGSPTFARPAYADPVLPPIAPPSPPAAADTPLQVTPDGYTILGQQPDESRRVALPPHIVRSGNQFSRAALIRISNYLATRAER